MAPKEKTCDCLGLAVEWENSAELRQRIRESNRVLLYPVEQKFCHPNRVNAVRNAMLVKPVLQRLRKTPKWRLPHLEDLEVEVRTLYDKCGLSTDGKKPYTTTVEIKKLAGLVSRKTKRREVTKEQGKQKNITS